MNQPAAPTPAATVGQQVVITVDQDGYEDRQIVGMQGVLTLVDTVSLKDNLAGDRDGAYCVRLPDGEVAGVADVRPADDKAGDERAELERLRRMKTRLAEYGEQGVLPDDVRHQRHECMHG